MACFSVAYCLAEGTLSVVFAALDRYISLMVFGLDSLIEVASASLVLWRLLGRWDVIPSPPSSAWLQGIRPRAMWERH